MAWKTRKNPNKIVPELPLPKKEIKKEETIVLPLELPVEIVNPEIIEEEKTEPVKEIKIKKK